MKLSLVAFNKEVLDSSFEWLNDPEIKFLTNSPSITKEEQIEWFKSLTLRTDYLLRGIKADEEIIGVMGLKNIQLETRKAEYFGYIGKKDFWGRGIGNWMLDSALDLANQNKIYTLYLNVIIENIVAINLYYKKGFKIVRRSGNIYEMQLELRKENK